MATQEISSLVVRQALFEHSESSDPGKGSIEDRPGHSSIGSTLPFTESSMSANSPCSRQLSSTSTRVHGDMFAYDEAVGYKLSNRLARVGIRDLRNFIWVKPDLALATANNGGGKPFLCTEVDPEEGEVRLA